MADLEFYKLSMTGAEADGGIRTGMEAGATSGVLLGDGQGGVRAASPGVDYGLPVLKGNGPPTANTAAEIGQHYFNMAAANPPYEYICVGLNSNGFVWIVFGETGDGFKISGYFASLEALEAAIEAGTVAQPTAGTAYGIGSAPPYDIFVWDAVNNDWVNNGPLSGYSGGEMPPHGDRGQALIKNSNIDFDAGWADVALHGQGAPTMDTAAAFVGQMYVDDSTNKNKLYAATGFLSTASGAIASFDDGAEDIPVKSLKVDIEPVQAGTGEPSPDNVRPISGWTGVKVQRSGKNLIDFEARRLNNVSISGTADDFSFTTTSSTIPYVGFDLIEYAGKGTLYLSAQGSRDITGSSTVFLQLLLDVEGKITYTDLTRFDTNNIANAVDKVINIPSNATRALLRIFGNNAQTEIADPITTTVQNLRLCSTPGQAYEPYQDATYDISFPDEAGTVYGGTLDVTNGVLTVDRVQIASYSGETLPGTWISDRNVYAIGSTPSVGAQVVYRLATPITYQLTPTEVKTLLGMNNIHADTGDVSVTYDGTKAAPGVKTIWTPVDDDVELAPGGVTTDKLAPGAVTTDKLANDAVTVEKLGFELPVNNSIQSTAATVAAVDRQHVTVCSLTVPVDGTYLLLGFLDSDGDGNYLYILGLTASESGLSQYVRGSMDGGGGMVNAIVGTLLGGEVVQLRGYSESGTTHNFRGKLTLIRLT